jgi:ABC-type spermidine/putrescine transport system permease subunit I
MEAQKETPPPIIDQLKEYAETRLKLAKYEAIDKSTTILASFVTDLIVAVSLILTFLFLSFSFAFYLSHLLGSYWQGFGCIAILYLVIAIIIILAKDKLQQPIINLFIKKLFR